MNHTLSYAAYAALGSPPPIDACAAAPDLAPRPHWRALGAGLAAPVAPLSAFQPATVPYWRGPVLTRAIPQLALSSVVVVTFIALLELSREHLLEVTQAEAYAPIYVRLAYTPS